MTHFQQWSKATPKEKSSMVQSEIRTVEEEQRRAKAVSLSRQGAWMKWNLPERKITWAELWRMEPFRISFMLREGIDGGHDKVLKHLAKILDIERKKKRPSKTEAKQIRFVREGDTGHATKSQQHFILDKGSDWNMRADIGKKLVFPECVQTTLRPDIVVWSQPSKMIVAIELTVPWEERCEEAYQRKKEKYTELMTTCRERGWKAWLFPVEVGCRGFPAQSVWRMLQAMGIVGKARKTAVRQLGEAAERSSCWLWHRRDDLSWKPSADE
ncbi:switch-associated protein 70 [Mytilus galloprovincialis]|uniref:Switch-associated protein 70 n=1 Tax=Mytilus galloprovincialis TaxID=29158 RepID=A0A8B6F4Z6_MYTGA|nr:switch-associated protein 70 [Mytilus galloprovincialis]